MSTTTENLADLTVAELRERAKGLGLEPGDVEPREAAGDEPIKSDWIRAIRQKELTTFRYATFENPRTGNQVTKRVTTEGKLSASNQEATGLTHVDEWAEVRARNRPHALARIEAGDGRRFRRNGDGTVEEVES